MDAASVLDLLVRSDSTLATVESLTGGQVAAAVTAVPGASRCYVGGLVTYATELKQTLVGVPEALVAEFGVVSAECARAMAEGARRVTGATYAVSTTGVAGPDSQEGHPVGTVFVGVAGPDGASVRALHLDGDRHRVQHQAVERALGFVADVLRREEPGLG